MKLISPRRLASIIRKEFRQLGRDRRTLRLLLFSPFMQLILFGYAVSTDLQNARLALCIQDHSAAARGLATSIEQTGAFIITGTTDNPDDLERWLADGTAQIAVHVPPGFDRALERHERPVVQVLADGSDSNTATLAAQYLQGAALAYGARLDERSRLRNPTAWAFTRRLPRVDFQPRVWYNPDLRSLNYLVPGVLALIMITVTTSNTALAIVREREMGTLEQLSVTPLTPLELLLGKTIPNAITGLIGATIVVIIAMLWFGVPIRGSIVALMVLSCIYLLNTLGMGLLISIVSVTQRQAQLTTSFMMTPMILLSGFLFPIANMAPWAQALTYVLPTRYYLEIVRGIFLKGQGITELWPQSVALAILGVGLYAGGIALYRKREA